MVGANGGGSFLVPWLIFLFGLVSSSHYRGVRSWEEEQNWNCRNLSNIRRKELRLDGAMDRLPSTAIGFYYAAVTGWCLNYFQTAVRGGLGSEVDTTEVWNSFLQSPTDVIMFQANKVQ